MEHDYYMKHNFRRLPNLNDYRMVKELCLNREKWCPYRGLLRFLLYKATMRIATPPEWDANPSRVTVLPSPPPRSRPPPPPPPAFSLVPLVVHQYSLKFLGEERRFFLRTQNNNSADLNSQRLEPKKTLAVRVISCL